MTCILSTWLSSATRDLSLQETPYFIFSHSRLIERFQEFASHFHASSVFYAMKANSEPEVLNVLNEQGSSFEIASIYELDLLRKLNVNPDRIIFGTSIKPAKHIRAAFEYGVDRFAFDSLAELHRIATEAPHSRVYVRVTVDDYASRTPLNEKFSTAVETVVPMLRAAQALDLIPYGISFHVGSQARDTHAWANAMKRLAPAIDELATHGIIPEVINIGGGFPCRYTIDETVPSLTDIAESIRAVCQKLGVRQQLILEPGRGIVAQAGSLVASVIARNERSGFTWLYLDAGVYSGLYETLVCQGAFEYHVTLGRDSVAPDMKFILAGPTGDALDVIARAASLPNDIDVGDQIIFHHVGAYSTHLATSFNGFPIPEIHYVE